MDSATILDQFHATRRRGNTTAIAECARKKKGIIICHSSKYADEIKREHGVDAIAIDNLNLSGFSGPFFADLSLLGLMGGTINDLGIQISRLESYLAYAEEFIDRLVMENSGIINYKVWEQIWTLNEINRLNRMLKNNGLICDADEFLDPFAA